MAHIFVSHSKKDLDLINFFAKAFAITNVKAIYEEIERRGTATQQQVSLDIDKSRAIFILLSENVQNIEHTRDWVLWETGVAKNKDVWVFEPYNQMGRIKVAIPKVNHYVIYHINDSWLNYIKNIIDSYDDSNVLSSSIIGAGLGALVGSALLDNKEDGAILGGLGGAILGASAANKSKFCPIGNKIECIKCHSVYSVHIPLGLNKIRCPVCNIALQIGNYIKL